MIQIIILYDIKRKKKEFLIILYLKNYLLKLNASMDDHFGL